MQQFLWFGYHKVEALAHAMQKLFGNSVANLVGLRKWANLYDDFDTESTPSN